MRLILTASMFLILFACKTKQSSDLLADASAPKVSEQADSENKNLQPFFEIGIGTGQLTQGVLPELELFKVDPIV